MALAPREVLHSILSPALIMHPASMAHSLMFIPTSHFRDDYFAIKYPAIAEEHQRHWAQNADRYGIRLGLCAQ
jgi:hypothetical protein